jgi:hypothetical protein
MRGTGRDDDAVGESGPPEWEVMNTMVSPTLPDAGAEVHELAVAASRALRARP